MAKAKGGKTGDVILVHWHDEEAATLARELTGAGVKAVRVGLPAKLSEVRTLAPRAVVVSLRRLPSHGREVVDALWSTKWGREIPVVFFDGEPEKAAKLMDQFPDATFCTFDEVPERIPG